MSPRKLSKVAPQLMEDMVGSARILTPAVANAKKARKNEVEAAEDEIAAAGLP